MRNKFLKRYLIRNSFLLFVLNLLSTILLISIYDNAGWEAIIIRSINIGICSLIVFFINANIVVYFKTKNTPKRTFKHIQKRIFICGYLVTVVVIVAQLLFNVLLLAYGINLHQPQLFKDAILWKMLVLVPYISLIQYTFIYLIQNFTLSQFEKNRVELQLLKLENANAETTNELLKQQIKPHFLFNALNTLKSLIKKNPNTAEDYLIRLSDFLRASFANNSNAGLSSIADELVICSNYMEMQKMRFGDSIQYEIDTSLAKNDSNECIPVFSLQPLIENAIKHNIATIQEPLIITLSRDEESITVKNNLQLKKIIEDSTGNGLSNLSERYRNLSGDEVIINRDNTYFSVSIKILKA